MAKMTRLTADEQAVIEAAVEMVHLWSLGVGSLHGHRSRQLIDAVANLHAEHDGRWTPPDRAAASDLLTLAAQYRDDMQHPYLTDDERLRRLALIERVIAKATGDNAA